MLESLPKFAELLLSNSANMLPRITTALPTRAANPRVVTQDPTTLTLAIVGIVTLAVYLAATGWRKPRPKDCATSRRQSTDGAVTPKRDAA